MSDLKIFHRLIIDPSALASNGATNVDKEGPIQADFGVDMAGTAMDDRHLDIPTTAAGTQITFTATLGTPGVVRITNLGTNYVEFGRQVGGTFYGFLKVLPGESWLFRADYSATQLYARANSATTSIRIRQFEE